MATKKQPKERLITYGFKGPLAWRTFFARRFRVRGEQSEWMRGVMSAAIEHEKKDGAK